MTFAASEKRKHKIHEKSIDDLGDHMNFSEHDESAESKKWRHIHEAKPAKSVKATSPAVAGQLEKDDCGDDLTGIEVDDSASTDYLQYYSDMHEAFY